MRRIPVSVQYIHDGEWLTWDQLEFAQVPREGDDIQFLVDEDDGETTSRTFRVEGVTWFDESAGKDVAAELLCGPPPD